MQNRKIRAFEEVFVIAFFIAAISLPLALLLLRGEGTPAWENRRLAELPPRPATLSDAYHLPRMLTDYFKDHFGLRAELIRWQADAKVSWLGTSSSPEVILGKDGWLFHSGELQTELYSGARPFTDAELAQWGAYLESTRDWLRGLDAEFVFVVVPEKQSIYPELMPDGVVRARTESRLDQLIKYLKARSGIRIVDLRPTLSEAKDKNQIYHRTDTHWNSLGALAAYQLIVRELGKDFGGTQTLSASDCDVVAASEKGGDLAGMLGLRDVMTEGKIIMQPKRPRARFEGNCGDVGQCVSVVDDESLPRLFMDRDSFSTYLIPFMAENFSRGVYVWDKKRRFYSDIIEAERPNVVLVEMTERSLMQQPPEGPPAPREH